MRADLGRAANGGGLPHELEDCLSSSENPHCSTTSLLSTIKSRSQRTCFCVGKFVRNMSEAHAKISSSVSSRPGAEAHDRCHHRKQFQSQQDVKKVQHPWQSQSSGSRIAHRMPSAKGENKTNLEKCCPKNWGRETTTPYLEVEKFTSIKISWTHKCVVCTVCFPWVRSCMDKHVRKLLQI